VLPDADLAATLDRLLALGYVIEAGDGKAFRAVAL
jgi:hypothetical protein